MSLLHCSQYSRLHTQTKGVNDIPVQWIRRSHSEHHFTASRHSRQRQEQEYLVSKALPESCDPKESRQVPGRARARAAPQIPLPSPLGQKLQWMAPVRSEMTPAFARPLRRAPSRSTLCMGCCSMLVMGRLS